eukprot:CAMPEP_0173189430 /NCGR_PEP_ID=MMETSP1141-20130122/11789_1 /TAXON_ID=483371 /ORGANISM="non described non described, Strain CCMP2298" /LENGTH=31 /DNA_ID= /DNA_START= /DNA_END= /DNA_ORIENTATION=
MNAQRIELGGLSLRALEAAICTFTLRPDLEV